MENENIDSGEILLYQSESNKEYVSVIFYEESFWLSQNGMAELFGCTPENILQHLKNIYAEEELSVEATTKKFLVVRKEGKRDVRRNIDHYNLDGKGKISHDEAVKNVNRIYEHFRIKQDEVYFSEFDKEMEKYYSGIK